MKRRMSLLLALLLTLCAAMAAAEDADLSAVDKQMDRYLKAYNATGASIVVSKGGKVVYSHNYGYSWKKGNELITDDSYYKIASVTKMVSAIRVMQLVEEGRLALDEDISTYLGYTVQNPWYKDTPLTLRMLMSHTGSFSSTASYTNTAYKLQDFLSGEKRKAVFAKVRPGSTYTYSNFGAGIMGSLIEKVTGENVEQSLIDHVFAPLGIVAACHAAHLPTEQSAVYLYKRNGGVSVGRKTLLEREWDDGVDPETHFRVTIGTIWMRTIDLWRVAQLLCNGGEIDGVRLLREETVAMMMADQKGQGAVTADTPYGLCVNRIDNLVKGEMWYGHQGMANDTACDVFFQPETDFVFVFCTNGMNNNMSDHIVKCARRLFDVARAAFGGEN